MKRLAALLPLLLAGCASTVIDVPGWGRLRSTKDNAFSEAEITVATAPDGTRTVHGKVTGYSGLASPVNESYAELVRAWTDLGIRIAALAASRASP